MKKLFALLLAVLFLAGCAGHDKYYALDHFYISEEGDAFRKTVDEFTVDMYEWYKSIEGEDGVYILHYEHYPEETLQEWKKTGYVHTIPEGDLSYYVASVNYLEDRGMTFSEEDKNAIQSGVRYYLIPDTCDDEETMKQFLTEDALNGLDGGSLIDTVFMKERNIAFQTYHFDDTFEVPGSDDIRDPVILAVSTENMKHFESESLIATGKTDSYIKLTEEAYRKYAKNALPQKLKDRKVTFLNISRISN